MKICTYKDKNSPIDKLDGLLFLDQDFPMIEYKNSTSSKLKERLTIVTITLFFIFIAPLKVLGGVMSKNGNTPFNALFFIVVSYFWIWICYAAILSNYTQHRLINKIEKDLNMKLKPALKN